jgi:uncharacterized membrane protein
MRNIPNQPQASDNENRGYAPQLAPEYPSVEGDSPQSGYQQQEYPSEQPYPPYYQSQQQQEYYSQSPPYTSTAGDVNPLERTSMGLKVRTAGVLCYLFTWIGGVVFLFLEPNNRFVRFHAMQSILFFGTLSILEWVSNFFPFGLFGTGAILGLVSFIGWIVLMVAAYRGRYYKLPIIGDYAEKLLNQVKI